jgi:hypothetical protein
MGSGRMTTEAEKWIVDEYKGQPVPLRILERFRNMTNTIFLKIILEDANVPRRLIDSVEVKE